MRHLTYFSTLPFNGELGVQTFEVGLVDLRTDRLAAMVVDAEITNRAYQAVPK
jgi:hypothetical protein